MSVRTAHARTLFAPLGPTYDRVGAVLSLGQDPLWRRFLVSRLPPGGHVLDVATGTGLVAAELLRRGFRVTGLDQSAEMLEIARRRFAGREVELVEGTAEALPFPDATFDHLTVTYLLRYVDDPGATLAELARVDRVLPLAGRALGRGWSEVGGFLGGSIRDFWARYPLERQLDLWRAAGLRD